MSEKPIKVVVTNHPMYDGLSSFFGWIIVFAMLVSIMVSRQYLLMLGLIIWFGFSIFLKFKKDTRITDSFFIPFGYGYALIALIQSIW